jgi:gas vesicle protein
VAGGSFILGLFGPIGAAIAGVSAISGIALVRSKNRKQVENIDKHIDSIRHDIESLDQKIQRLWQIMNRSDYNNETRLKPTLKWVNEIQPKKYKEWNDDQRHELEKLVNVVSNTVQLINERV